MSTADRGPASCLHCEGNPLAAITYEEELRGKAKTLNELLAAAAVLKGLPGPVEIVPGPSRTGYRNSAKLVFGFDKQARRPLLGIYRPGTHQIVDLEFCQEHHPAMQSVIAWVKQAVLDFSLPVYNEERAKGFLRYLLLKVLPDGRMLAAFVTPHEEGEWQQRLEKLAEAMRAAFPEMRVISQNINPDRGNRILGRKSVHLAGQHSVPCHFLDVGVPVGPYTFLQANLSVFRLILEEMSERVHQAGDASLRVADLYCGCGAIGRSITSTQPLLLMEGEFHSQMSMVEGAREDGRDEIMAIRGKIEDSLVSIELFNPQLVIVDPPRKGLDADLVQQLLELDAGRMLYLSCDPRSLIRDLEALSARYHVRSLKAWDMMPLTPHVECLAELALRD
jgi:23S rRNA (uracil1939-C5)-methyltransferase